MQNSKTSRGKSLDRKKVAGGQEYEVKYESGKTSASSDSVKSAIRKSGNSRSKVESTLGKTKTKRK
ncbi:MAG TPA: DUF3606 domain-containing protein [Puia sp.]|jgi:hypothetical protein